MSGSREAGRFAPANSESRIANRGNAASTTHSRLPASDGSENTGPFISDPVRERLDGAVPVAFSPGLETLAGRIQRHLDAGMEALADIFDSETDRRETVSVEAIVVADGDWEFAPRENEHPYPPGLPYFTRSTEPPTLVLPEKLSSAIQPRTEATLPLAVWHELAHAFILQRPTVKTPAWLREFIPQAASAAVAKREGLPLESHLEQIDHPGFTARGFRGSATAEEQMSFQNLLLSLGNAAVEESGEGFLKRLVHQLWDEEDVVGEARAEKILAESLGSGGGAWLEGRGEF